MSDITDKIFGLGGQFIDAKYGQSNDGLARTGVPPEQVADQATVGTQDPNHAASNQMSTTSIQFSQPILVGTGLLLAGMALVRFLR